MKCRLAAATLAAALILGSAGCASAPTPASGVDPATVRIAAMAAGPVWVAQATWDLRERHLVAADPVAGEVFVFDRKGKIVRRLAKPGQGPLDFPRPAYAFVVGDRYLIGARPTRWVRLNERFAPVDSISLEWEEPGASDYHQLDLFSFDAGATKFVGVGEMQSHDLSWSGTAMFAVPYRRPGQLENLGSVEADSDELASYRSYPSKVAACGGQIYLMRMSARLAIERFGDSPGTLGSFPEAFRQRPALPTLFCGPSVPEREAAKAVAQIAEGLFCLEDRWLLLLAHQPRDDGGTQWLVYPVDPVADALGEAIELPTRAAEIVFVAGKKRWALLEKGPMRQVGDQPLTQVVTFPRPEFTFLRR